MDFASFLNLIDASYIYEGGKRLSVFIASTITPFLLVIAIWLRLAQSQLEVATSGRGKWGAFLKDMGVWLTILGLYFVIAGLLSDVFNNLYDYFSQQGSLAVIQEQFIKMIEEIDSRGDDDQGFFDKTFDVMGNAVTFTVWLVYYASFLIATFLIKFLKMAHALAWSFALVWGLIAIPMSLTSSFKLLKGWGVFTGIVLLWPLFHFGGFALFNPIFEHAAAEFVSGGGAGLASIDKAQLYLIMTFVNALSIAVALAAPFVAQAFVSNSGSIAGVVAPFALAATSMAGAGVMQMRERFKQGSGIAGSASKGILKSGVAPLAKSILPGGGGSKGAGGSSSGFPPTSSPDYKSTFGDGVSYSFSIPQPSATGDMPFSADGTTSSGGKGENLSSESSVNARAGGATQASGSPSGAGGSAKTSSSETNVSEAANKVTTKTQGADSRQSAKVAPKLAAASMAGTSAGEIGVADTNVEETAQSHGKPRSAKSTQARRGAILDQAHKSGKINLKGRS